MPSANTEDLVGTKDSIDAAGEMVGRSWGFRSDDGSIEGTEGQWKVSFTLPSSLPSGEVCGRSGAWGPRYGGIRYI